MGGIPKDRAHTLCCVMPPFAFPFGQRHFVQGLFKPPQTPSNLHYEIIPNVSVIKIPRGMGEMA